MVLLCTGVLLDYGEKRIANKIFQIGTFGRRCICEIQKEIKWWKLIRI